MNIFVEERNKKLWGKPCLSNKTKAEAFLENRGPTSKTKQKRNFRQISHTPLARWRRRESISAILVKGGLYIFIWRRARCERGGGFLEGGSMLLEITIINFTSWTLSDLLSTCGRKDFVLLVIFYSSIQLISFYEEI